MKDLCEVITDGTHDSPKLQKEGIPFVKGKHISSGSIDFENCDFISYEDHVEACRRVKPKKGDILFSNIGSVGDTARVSSNTEFSIKNVALFRANKNKVDQLYLYYLVLGPDFKANVLNVRSGSAQPFISLANLRSFEVKYIDNLPIQRRIAGILSAYDDLIENCQRRIKILEEMARSLYREWFVNFRIPEKVLKKLGLPPIKLVDSELGPIPEGWEVKNIKEVAKVVYGYPFKSKRFNVGNALLPVVRIRDILSGKTETYTDEPTSERYRIKNGEILVGMDGDFHMTIWSGGEAWQNQRVVRFLPMANLCNFYLFLALENPIKLFNKSIIGTTVAHLGDSHIKSINILLPPYPLLHKAACHLNPLEGLMIKLKLRIKNLRQTRDLLLPRLLSGEIPLESAEEEIPASEPADVTA